MPYLTVSEYVARFGAQETTNLTFEGDLSLDPPPERIYDTAKVETAIGDAGDTVDTYVAARYATPITSPPSIVKGWVAVLARETLHVNVGRVTDAVKDAADVVRRQLADLSAGRTSLPIPASGDAPASVGLGYAETSNDQRPSVFGGGILDALTSPFVGLPDVPRWRQ